MTDKIMYWTSVLFSGFALLLFIVDTGLIGGNRELQGKVSQRQNAINTAMQLAPLNQSLSQAIAEAAETNNDKDLKDLLTSQGITYTKVSPKEEKKTTPEKK